MDTRILAPRKKEYILRDDFTTDQLASAMNGTVAEPGPGIRTVTDTESKLSTTSGLLVFAGGKATAAFGDPALWGRAVTRKAGRLLCGIKRPNVSGYSMQFGFGSAQSGQIDKARMMLGTSPAFYYSASRINDLDGGLAVEWAIVLRDLGAFIFAKEVGAANWRLWFVGYLDATATLYPGISNFSIKTGFDFIKIPLAIYSPPAVVSDSFNRVALGTVTDGLGHPEGVGGANKTWVSQVGTWKTISSTLLAPNVLSGGIGIITADGGSPNYIVSAKLTRNAGTVGIVVRYVDANNYIWAYRLNDGSEKIAVHKLVAGVDTEVMAPTANTANGYVFQVIVSGTKLHVVDRDSVIGSELVVADAALQSSTLAGIIATNTNVTIDNFVVFNQNGYAGLDSFFPITKNILPFGDSKTMATSNLAWSGYPPLMTTNGVPMLIEYPTRIALGGTTVRTWQAAIDASLAAALGTPDLILCNLGVNDTRDEETTPYGPPFDWATWVTNYEYILDAFHVKWPSAKIYIMRPWCRTADVATRPVDFAEMDNARIPAIVAARPTFCYLGPDERVFLENGDDGATYTYDGVHPNAAGYVLTASQWRSALGLT